MKLNQVTVGCLDYDRSAAFYRQLGLTQIVDSPLRYARFETFLHDAGLIDAPFAVDAIAIDVTAP